MPLQAVSGLYLPNLYDALGILNANNSNFQAKVIDASAEKVAFIFNVPKTGTLNGIGFRLGTVTTGDTLKASFQDVDATTGNPDGTADQFRTVVIAGTDDDKWIDVDSSPSLGLMTSDGTDTGTKRSVTRDDLLSIVIEFNSFVAGNMEIQTLGGNSAADNTHYVDHFTAAWAKDANASPIFALKYSDGTYAYISGCFPAKDSNVVGVNTGSTPDEVALYFQVPFSCKVNGAAIGVDLDEAADVVLYDSDGTTVLASKSLDADLRANTIRVPHECQLTETTLLANTNYRLAIKPTTVTNISVPFIDVAAQAIFDQMSGGQNMHWSQRTDAGAWSQTTTRRPWMAIRISALDDGTGSAAAPAQAFAPSIAMVNRYKVTGY